MKWKMQNGKRHSQRTHKFKNMNRELRWTCVHCLNPKRLSMLGYQECVSYVLCISNENDFPSSTYEYLLNPHDVTHIAKEFQRSTSSDRNFTTSTDKKTKQISQQHPRRRQNILTWLCGNDIQTAIRKYDRVNIQKAVWLTSCQTAKLHANGKYFRFQTC